MPTITPDGNIVTVTTTENITAVVDTANIPVTVTTTENITAVVDTANIPVIVGIQGPQGAAGTGGPQYGQDGAIVIGVNGAWAGAIPLVSDINGWLMSDAGQLLIAGVV